MADFPERRPWVPPNDQDRERLTLATARVLCALLDIGEDGNLPEHQRLHLHH
jgi:uncharacterized protein (UPF0147 family)